MNKEEAKKRIEAAERELAEARKALEGAEEKIVVTFEATKKQLQAYAILSSRVNEIDGDEKEDPLYAALEAYHFGSSFDAVLADSGERLEALSINLVTR